MTRITRLAIAALLLAGCAAAVSAAEVVILKDGFVIQGNVSKEVTMVYDKASGLSVPVMKGNGFDMIDEGPKVTIFSGHARQLKDISTTAKLRPEYRSYTTRIPGFKNFSPLPNLAGTVKVAEFNEKWYRRIDVRVPGTSAIDRIDQQVIYLDPYWAYMVSATHKWRVGYRVAELGPELVLKLLRTHPDLAEPDKKCDPVKRIAIAKFLLDAGWLKEAKEEIERLERDFTGELTKDAKEQYAKITKEIDEATADQVVREAELALAAGRYSYADDLLARFPEKKAAPKDVARAGKVLAELKTNRDRFTNGRRLLIGLVEQAREWRSIYPLVAAGGGLAITTWQPPKNLSPRTLELAAAALQVYAELHPDSAERIDTFVALALQAERETAAGREPSKKVDELLATAISGWAKGQKGATPNPAAALKLWNARQSILAYQRSPDPTERDRIFKKFKDTGAIELDELALLMSLLPPADPEDLANRTGELVTPGKGIPQGVYRRTTPQNVNDPGGMKYLVKLPPEYHHGRSYPVLIVLTHTGVNPEQVLPAIVNEADRNGYILLLPEWTDVFGGPWEYKGEDHRWVTSVLRDAVRHFTVDNDRVFLLGVGEGANMALDVGMSHPDLFAGVVPVAATPKWPGFFIEYWKNAQKLPFYCVTGELATESFKNHRFIYEKWVAHGFPGLMAVYKGRGLEWYPAEVPVLFDWMGRKTRVNGTATLQLGTGPRFAWQMMRPTDTRFYWLEANRITPGKSGGSIVTAEMSGDIRGNVVHISCRNVKALTIWLSPDMIDLAKPIGVNINGSVPNGYRAKLFEPDLKVLLDDYFERGDRRTLFLNKIEFNNIP